MSTLALLVPAYNAAWCLPRLLESAAAQTVPFDDIVVYDDGSTDDTAEVATRLGARVVTGDENVGCSAGKNRLAGATDCEWVHFHDADDELLPTFVEEAQKWMARGDEAPDVVLFGYEERWDDTGELLGVRTFDDEALRADPVAYTIRRQINPFLGLYRRRVFLDAGGYDLDPEVLYNEDVAFHCKMARAGLTFRADPAVVVVNHRVRTSMSQANGAKCARAQYHVMRKAAALSGEPYHRLVADRLWSIAAVAGRYLDWETADAAARLASRLGGRVPAPSAGGPAFRALAAVSPRAALRLRETAVRRLRPALRA